MSRKMIKPGVPILWGVLVWFVILSCQDRGDDIVSEEIRIISPPNLDTVYASGVEVEVEGYSQEGGYSITYQVNSGTEITVFSSSFEVRALEIGINTISVRKKNGQEILQEARLIINRLEGADTVYVSNGTGSGPYEAGDVVVIEADSAEIPYVFNFWSGPKGFFADSSLNPTFFTMPDHPVRVHANYRIDSVYFKTLNVAYGTGGGKYLPEDTVSVTLDMDPPLVFEYWSGGSDFLGVDSLSEDITFQMPDREVDLLAKWSVSNVSFKDHLFPIFQKHCNDSGCHGDNGSPSYQTHQAIIQDSVSIVGKTQSRNMPPPLYGHLSDEDIEIIRVWVEEGMKDN